MSEIRKPIANEEAEKALIAAMIHKGKTLTTLAHGLGVSSDMFTMTACRILFVAISAICDNDEGYGDIELISELKKGGRLEAIGGPAAIADISSEYRAGRSFEKLCSEVKKFHVLRQISIKCSQIDSEARDGQDASSLTMDLKSAAEDLTGVLSRDSDIIQAKQAAKMFLDDFQELVTSNESPGIQTGISEIDNITGGMRKGEFWVVSGPTSGGKSVLTLQACANAIRNDKHVLLFSLEMTASEVICRMVSNLGRISMGDLTNPNGGDKGVIRESLVKIRNGVNYISDKRLKIADKSGMTSDWITSQCERVNEIDQIDLIAIDYIQLVEGKYAKGQSREQEISKISKDFKQLAKKCSCAVITPSQLNDDGKLRESRGIGHDANVVLDIKDDGVFVAKNRNGKKFVTLPLAMNGEFQRFEFDQNLQLKKN